MTSGRRSIAAASGLALLALSACSNQHDLTMRMHLSEPIRVEGPMMVFEGMYISDALFERIKVGETTEDWVIALLGEPTTISELDDGTEV